MAFAIIVDGQPVEIQHDRPFASDGVQYPANWLTFATPDDLAAAGVRSIVETAIPDGKVSTGWTLEYDAEAGTVTRVHTLADAPPPPAPAQADVWVERERRLALGFDYDFGDARGVHRIGTTEADMRGWDEVTKIAQARHALGQTAPIQIVTDTAPVQITPLEWFAILNAASGFRQPVWHASFLLQAMDPIPADFRDDQYWPA